MKIIKTGITRWVIVCNTFAIKFPKNNYSHLHFLHGCSANWSERHYTKMFIDLPDQSFIEKVAPSYFCSCFGLFQIMARCKPMSRDLTIEEVGKFKDVCTDIKRDNFGIYKGRVVCLDYA